LASRTVQQLYGPNGCREGHLIGYSRHGSVSLDGYTSSFVEISKLDSLGAVWIVSLMWCVAVHATDWWVSASWTFLAGRKSTWVISSVVGTGTNGTANVIPTEGSGVSVRLAIVALGAPPIWDVVIQLAFSIAYDQVLTADRTLLDVTRQCHDNCRVGFMLVTVCRCQPVRRLPLYQLRVVGGDTVEDLGY